MKLALVVPETPSINTESDIRKSIKLTVPCPPLNLMALASYVRFKKPNLQIKILDGSLSINVWKELCEFKPDIVGVTACTPQASSAYALGDKLRMEMPNAYTVMGGVHASALPEEAQQHFDCIVIGEGEKALVEILDKFEQDQKTTGIIEGKPLENLDEEPMPAYDLLPMERYLNDFSLSLLKKPMLMLVTSRGCLFSCPFCYNSNRKYPPRWFSAERVVDELEYLNTHYKVASFYFADDEFLIKKERLAKIAELMKERNLHIRWGCQARANTIDLKTLMLAKSMGCVLVIPGFESMSPRILNYLKCGTTTVEANERVVGLMDEAGLNLGGNFIFGSPGETLDDMQLTVEWIFKNGSVKFANFNTLIPFPGTAVYKKCKDEGWLPKVVEYDKFNMTYIIEGGYWVDHAVSLKEYRNFMIHMQRIGWVLFRLRLGTKFYRLLGDLHFWWILAVHPHRTGKMVWHLVRHEPIVC